MGASILPRGNRTMFLITPQGGMINVKWLMPHHFLVQVVPDYAETIVHGTNDTRQWALHSRYLHWS